MYVPVEYEWWHSISLHRMHHTSYAVAKRITHSHRAVVRGCRVPVDRRHTGDGSNGAVVVPKTCPDLLSRSAIPNTDLEVRGSVVHRLAFNM